MQPTEERNGFFAGLKRVSAIQLWEKAVSEHQWATTHVVLPLVGAEIVAAKEHRLRVVTKIVNWFIEVKNFGVFQIGDCETFHRLLTLRHENAAFEVVELA